MKTLLKGVVGGSILSALSALFTLGLINPDIPFLQKVPFAILIVLFAYPLGFIVGARVGEYHPQRRLIKALVIGYVTLLGIVVIAPVVRLDELPGVYAGFLFVVITFALWWGLWEPDQIQESAGASLSPDSVDFFNSPTGSLPPALADLMRYSPLTEVMAKHPMALKEQALAKTIEPESSSVTLEDVVDGDEETLASVEAEAEYFTAPEVPDTIELPGAVPIEATQSS